MKISLIAVGLTLLGILSCSEEEFDRNDFWDNSSITTLNGTWKVVSYEDFNTQKVEFRTEENSWGLDVIVTFNDTVDPHEFSGQITTNSVFGEFDYVGKRQFKLHRFGTTFVGQPEWGDKFGTAVLDGVVTFKINAGHLRIYYDGKSKSVTLKKEPQ